MNFTVMSRFCFLHATTDKKDEGSQPQSFIIHKSFLVEKAAKQCTAIRHDLHMQTVRTPHISRHNTWTPSVDSIHEHPVCTAQA